MTKHPSQPSRRRFIKFSAVGLAAAPFANILLSESAQAGERVSESDATAKALDYAMDATKATSRKDDTAFCSTCNLYSGQPGAPDGPCQVLGNKLVMANGWCSAWVKKA